MKRRDRQYKLYCGDCLVVLKTLETNSIDAIVTDPPAGISFMGKEWDHDRGGRNAWIGWMMKVALECRRVLKPGGHALVWALPRTSHWTAMAWENAGFEVRDRIAHVFGQGFPKSQDIGKMIDKTVGVTRTKGKRERRGGLRHSNRLGGGSGQENGTTVLVKFDTPATTTAKQWDGWGTALKPAVEDWWLFRKSLSESTIAANILKWGTGAINIDICRIKTDELTPRNNKIGKNGWKNSSGGYVVPSPLGRWPANLVHDGSDEVVKLFPQSAGQLAPTRGDGAEMSNNVYAKRKHPETSKQPRGDVGSAARFFYCAKASKQDRDDGLDGQLRNANKWNSGRIGERKRQGGLGQARNNHPTVKPLALMQYLCKLITPLNGLILDPFMGSGSTGKATMLEGFRFIGIEQDKNYFKVAQKRIEHAAKSRK